jgi:hypothetical protein
MDQVYQGSQYTARVVYRSVGNALVDPDDPMVSIYDPNGAALYQSEPIVRDDVGQYHFTFLVPTDAAVGDWTVVFLGTVDGRQVESSGFLQVLDASQVSQMQSTINHIRLAVGEKIPVGGSDGDTRFTDIDILSELNYAGQDLNKVKASLWLAKSGMWAELVDIDESGTDRSLSQMSKAALAQAKIYLDKVAADDVLWAQTYRVAGRSFKAWGQCDMVPRWMWEPVTVRA